MLKQHYNIIFYIFWLEIQNKIIIHEEMLCRYKFSRSIKMVAYGLNIITIQIEYDLVFESAKKKKKFIR